MKIRLLILGITGMLGHTLFTHFSSKSDQYEVYGTARHSEGLDRWLTPELLKCVATHVDVNQNDTVIKIIGDIRPHVIINCVGIIKQLAAAENPLTAIPINALFPHRLANLCRLVEARLIHISTDCVFSGRKGNYTEDDVSDADDLYGRTKFLGEIRDEKHCLTLRTSIIGRELHTQYGLIEWFLSQKGKTVKGFARAIYTGFTTRALAEIIASVIEQNPDLSGLWHVSSDPISKYELLQLVNQAFDLGITLERDESYVCDRSLNSTRFRQATGYQPPTWQNMINQLVNKSKDNSTD